MKQLQKLPFYPFLANYILLSTSHALYYYYSTLCE
jgi:hypothetical protein